MMISVSPSVIAELIISVRGDTEIIISNTGSSALRVGEKLPYRVQDGMLYAGSRSWEPPSREGGPRRSAILSAKRWVFEL
jgi:hypothetical protein